MLYLIAFNAGVAYRKHKPRIGITPKTGWKGVKNAFVSVSSQARTTCRGTLTAVREGTRSNGRYCREFRQTITVGGRKEDAFGTACQKPDSSWEIVSD
ncbi:MAG: hypothetical protein ACRCYW_14235 [Aeromonas sp.]|uniref:hypothetical protein n=1 Tax=Aeromonas sp. TaxID=647 RepID=UPI003F3A12EE